MYLWASVCGSDSVSGTLAQSVRVRVRNIVLRESCPRNWFDFCDTIELFIGLKLKWKRRDRRKWFHVVPCDRSHSRSHSRRQLWATVIPLARSADKGHKNAIHGRADKASRETIIYIAECYMHMWPLKPSPPLFHCCHFLSTWQFVKLVEKGKTSQKVTKLNGNENGKETYRGGRGEERG